MQICHKFLFRYKSDRQPKKTKPLSTICSARSHNHIEREMAHSFASPHNGFSFESHSPVASGTHFSQNRTESSWLVARSQCLPNICNELEKRFIHKCIAHKLSYHNAKCTRHVDDERRTDSIHRAR